MTEPQTMADRFVIEIVFDDPDIAAAAYEAIEKMLVEMGEVGTLSYWRRTRNERQRKDSAEWIDVAGAPR
jgi:hypothetical protein